MKALVTVKRVLDPYVKVVVKDGCGVDLRHAKMTINPFDEIAVEAALQLRETSCITEVVILTIGGDSCQETLRQALALGADRAILVRTEHSYSPLNLAKIMQHVVNVEQPQLVLMGKQSIDYDNNQTPQMLAGLLNWPQALFASNITLTTDTVTVDSELDTGIVQTRLQLPAIISTDLRLNTPRYISLPNIMKAKQKPLQVIDIGELNLSLRANFKVLTVAPPIKRPIGEKINSIPELLQRLKQDLQ